MSLVVWRCVTYSTTLNKAILEKLISDGIIVSTYTTEILLLKVQRYCQSSAATNQVCLLIDIWNQDLINGLCRLFQLPNLKRRPRVVVLSTLLTWAGKLYPNAIHDANAEFCNRRPIAAAEEAWKSENCLWNIASKTKADIGIIGFGLLYGLDGFDFVDIFKSVWLKSTGAAVAYRVPSIMEGKNRVPMLHFEDAVGLIANAVRQGITSNSSTSPINLAPSPTITSPTAISLDFSGPSYIPAVDTNERSLVELFPDLQYCKSASEIVDIVFESEKIELYLWNCDMCFTQPIYSCINISDVALDGKYSQGISTQFPQLWQEYLSANSLSPVKIMVVGGPKTGKTQVAQDIANRLNLEYINVVSAVKFILDNEEDLQEGFDPSSSPLASLRSEIAAALEAGDQKKGGKGKKDKGPAESVRMNSSTFEVTEQTCQTLPDSLVRKCIYWRIAKFPKCELSGFVLDAWVPFISNYDQLCEAVAPAQDNAAAVNADERSSEEAVQQQPALNLAKYLEVVIELQCADAVVGKRYLEVIGGVDEKGKISKESQALIKALEAAQQGYNEKVKPISSVDPELPSAKVVGDSTEVSHSGVLAIASAATELGVIRIVRTGDAAVSSADALVGRSIDGIISLHGKIGWYSSSDSAADATPTDAEEPVSPAEGADEEEEGEEGEEGEDVEGEDEGDAVDEPANGQPDASSDCKSNSAMESVNKLGPKERDILSKKVAELQQYLLDNVLPHLARGMVHISREQPDDPIGYLESYIRTVAIQIESSTVEKVRNDFYRTIREVEENQQILKS